MILKANLNEFEDLLSQPEEAAIELLFCKRHSRPNNETQSPRLKSLLRKTSASLFREIELLGQQYSSLTKLDVDPKQHQHSWLSGLEQLYTGDDDGEDAADAETLWGQVELQNTALLKILKRSVKELTKADTSDIRLLEDDIMDSDEDDEVGQQQQQEENESFEVNSEGSSNSDEASDVDEETKRIRERMKRTMKDMDEDVDDDDSSASSSDEEDEIDNKNSVIDDEDIEKDHVVADLHDGFFNLLEMEAFADEEEDYLPEDAYGLARPDEDDDMPKDRRTFHQKQRDGDVGGDESDIDDDNDDEKSDNALLFRKETTVRRRKYREDDEIDALDSLYEAPANDDSAEDSVNDVVNMTAADLFGKPNRKYFEKWNSKTKRRTNPGGKGDDDSWNDFDFDQQEVGKAGWNDDDSNSSREQSGEESERERGQYKQDTDERVPMKGNKETLPKTAPTKQAAKLLVQTEQLEKEMLAEKPWQMKGETGSSSRPVNSLLDATPEFEIASKIVPVITEEHTADLEEVIKLRILAEDWDDVIPRELPDVGWHKKRGDLPEVSQEKAKLGLGELYEREYLKKAVGYDVDAVEKQTEEEKAKNEMKTLFANLCSKLDALSNYHFAPRPIADEAEVRPVTMPAIAMEEVLPVHVSDARGVAPEEVYGAKRSREGILRDDSELKQQERKRLRGSKKAARRKARKEKLADEKLISRLQPGLGLNNPYEKRKVREELSMARAGGRVTTGVADTNDYGGSGTFFKRMQQEAEQAILGEKDGMEDKKPSARVSGKSSALKL